MYLCRLVRIALSLKPLSKSGSKRGWRTSFMCEYFSENAMPWLIGMSYKAIRTERYRLTVWVGRNDHSRIEAVELYDHKTDPQENTNIAKHPEQAKLVEQLMTQWRAGWRGARQGVA